MIIILLIILSGLLSLSLNYWIVQIALIRNLKKNCPPYSLLKNPGIVSYVIEILFLMAISPLLGLILINKGLRDVWIDTLVDLAHNKISSFATQDDLIQLKQWGVKMKEEYK